MTTKHDEDKLLRSVALQNANSILIARQRAEQRREAYPAEAQRLSHTGSFGWKPSTGLIGAYGKGLKKLLKPSIWTEVEQTYVGPAIEDNWGALFRTISLFRKIAKEVACFLEFRYPDELDQRVVQYLQQVRTAVALTRNLSPRS